MRALAGLPDLSGALASLHELVDLVRQIQQALDLSGDLARAIRGQGGSLIGLARLIHTTEDPARPGAPLTGVAPVRDLTHLAQLAADAALVLAFTWAFYRVMWAAGARHPHGARELLPRGLLAVLLVNLTLPLVQGAIDVDNALSAAIADSTFRADLIGLARQTLDPAPDPFQLLTDAALFAGTLLLGLVYVIRLTLLAALTVLAPVAALLSLLPETQHYAREWAGLFITTLFMQPIQLLLLEIGFGLDRHGGLPLRHLFALAALFLTFKVPGALNSSSRVGGRALTLARREANRAWRQASKAMEADFA